MHAVLLTPDGKGLFLVTGNNAKLDRDRRRPRRVPKLWGEDHLLPRMPDGRGFMRDVLAPGGIIYRVSPDGKQFEVFASGFRNIFDAAFNRDGELFTYDADMEYDFNTSWYRPTRDQPRRERRGVRLAQRRGQVARVVSDNLPATLNIGPGSPTGMTFGYGAKFPAKYQNALFALDWSWGKLYAVHLKPRGRDLHGHQGGIHLRRPAAADRCDHPSEDGAMYFAIGGRKVQSGFYRVTYTGSEATAPSRPQAPDARPSATLRQKLEAFHGKQDPKAVDAAWPHLGHQDRFIRWAARTAIEHQPVAEWADKALGENEPDQRSSKPCSRSPASPASAPRIASRRSAGEHRDARQTLDRAARSIDFAELTHEQRLTLVRTVEIVLHRFGNPDDATVAAIIAKLDPALPAPTTSS